MTVIILERVAPGLRGELSKWMAEVGTGVFVGRLSATVRERLWAHCEREATGDGGSALMVWRAATAQGFAVRSANPRGRYAEELDGVWLVRIPGPPKET